MVLQACPRYWAVQGAGVATAPAVGSRGQHPGSLPPRIAPEVALAITPPSPPASPGLALPCLTNSLPCRSFKGKRFQISRTTLFNVEAPSGEVLGQAVTIREWEYEDGTKVGGGDLLLDLTRLLLLLLSGLFIGSHGWAACACWLYFMLCPGSRHLQAAAGMQGRLEMTQG